MWPFGYISLALYILHVFAGDAKAYTAQTKALEERITALEQTVSALSMSGLRR